MIKAVTTVKTLRGFTLLELVTVMGIVAILAAIAIPSFRYVTYSNRVASEVNALVGDVQYARTEAIKEGTPVTICVSTNPTAVNPTCAGAADSEWDTGWIIFSDVNQNQQVDTGEAVLRAQAPLGTAFGGLDTMNSDYGFTAMTFYREGFGSTNVGGVNTVTITLHTSPQNSAWTHCIAISPVGLVQTETPATPSQPGEGCS
jgi:type IV fimbrial biogenesis protein FimT